MNRLEREKLTIEKMMGIYCSLNHGTENNQLCPECSNLLDYSFSRIRKCPYGENKPDCQSCPIHCYQKDRRAEMKKIMRFAGPRMLYKFPVLALLHFYDKYVFRINARKEKI